MYQSASTEIVTLDRLIEAAFERARLVTSSPKVAAGLASRTVARWLARTGRLDLVRLLDPNTTPAEARPMARVRQAQAA